MIAPRLLLCAWFVLGASVAEADIYRWDNGEVIPGTEGIEPGPGVQLDHQELSFARLNFLDLYGAVFSYSDLRFGSFLYSNLSGAKMRGANLENASFGRADLSNADLKDAVIRRAVFEELAPQGLAREQLYATASYRAKDLTGINMSRNELTDWDFSKQGLSHSRWSYSTLVNADFRGADLSNSVFWYARLANAKFDDAVLGGADLSKTTTRGFAPEQLYSTASYRTMNLKRLILSENDLSGWDFHGQDLSDAQFVEVSLAGANLRGARLTNAILDRSNLANADLTGAEIASAAFGYVTSFAKEQLYSTASYQAKNLRGVWFAGNDFDGWDFQGQDLTHAQFAQSSLVRADFSDANMAETSHWDADFTGAAFRRANLSNAALYAAKLNGCDFRGADLTGAGLDQASLRDADMTGAKVSGAYLADTTMRGFTKEQLYSTASYQERNLGQLSLAYNDLSEWNFRGQPMDGASFLDANLTGANLRGARLFGARFDNAVLSGADLRDAQIAYAGFPGAGLAYEQLASTASFQAHDLEGLDLGESDLSGWDFSGQYLANASFFRSDYDDADFSFADLRGSGATPSDAFARNTIRLDGSVVAPAIAPGETLLIRDYPPFAYGPIPILVQEGLTVSPNGKLQVRFEPGPWNSLISFEPNIPVQLAGTLEFTFADGTDVATQIGRTIRIFDWTGVEPTGLFTVSSPYDWDTSELYTTGEITLTAVPEPSGLLIGSTIAVALCVISRLAPTKRPGAMSL